MLIREFLKRHVHRALNLAYGSAQTPKSHRNRLETSVSHQPQETDMSLGAILLVVLILMLLGAIPSWPHSRSWGYAPSGILGLFVVVLLVLIVTGRM